MLREGVGSSNQSSVGGRAGSGEVVNKFIMVIYYVVDMKLLQVVIHPVARTFNSPRDGSESRGVQDVEHIRGKVPDSEFDGSAVHVTQGV